MNDRYLVVGHSPQSVAQTEVLNLDRCSDCHSIQFQRLLSCLFLYHVAVRFVVG